MRSSSANLLDVVMLIAVAVAVLAIAGPVRAEALPPWMDGDSSQPVPPPDSDSPGAPDLRSAGDRSPANSGPFLEEFLIDDQRAIERVMDRDTPAIEPTVNPPTIVDDGSRYLIQPSDVLVLSVWREPDLLREVTVSPDGWITFPLVGELYVEGSTVSEVRSLIEERIQRFINRAAVNVTLKQTLGNRVYVLGKVNNPGVFPFSKKLNVMQALSLAGGVSKFAASDSIRIIRETEDAQTSYRFNYAQVMKGRSLSQNIRLRSGDVVMVP